MTSLTEGKNGVRYIRPDGFGGYVATFRSGARLRVPMHRVAHVFEFVRTDDDARKNGD